MMKTKSVRRLVILIGCISTLWLAAFAFLPRAAQATPTNVTDTPVPTLPPPSTLTADQVKENLEIEKLDLENEKLKSEKKKYWLDATSVTTAVISMIGVLLAVLVGFGQWRGQQTADREKRDEERFQNVVRGFESDREEARVGAAISLLTFLKPGYERFHRQVFQLAVSLLRLRKYDPQTPEPIDAMNQALITVLKEAFPIARGDDLKAFDPITLDATGAQLDQAYLSNTDLRKIRFREGSFREAHFWNSQLQGAYFKHSDLTGAHMQGADLENADLGYTTLVHANLSEANLREAHIGYSDFTGADLTQADLTGADLKESNIQLAKSLRGAILTGVEGLTPAQITSCKRKGALVE